MAAILTKEDVINWRRSTEKITLEEYARRLGKILAEAKETDDLHDLLSKKAVETPVEIVQEKAEKQEKQEKPEKKERPDIEIKISFKEKLNEREELVFNYFFKNKKRKVFAKEIAKILNLPNDYVYKYIKNLRKKLETDVLVNAENGGYILDV